MPMKLKAFGAGIVGLAFVAGSVALAAPAHAATIEVDASSIPAESNPYAAGWFAGSVAGGTGSAAQSAAGLAIVGGATGYQLLNGAPANGVGNTTAAASNLAVSTVGGDAFYQISVFAEPGEADPGFTTLRPVDAHNLGGDWVNSRAFSATAPVAAGTAAPLSTHLGLLDELVPAEVLAFGVFVNGGDNVTLRSISWNGDAYLFNDAALQFSATSVPFSSTDPVVMTVSGFAPGDEIDLFLNAPAGSGLLATVFANADGIVTHTFAAGGAIGTYTVTATSQIDVREVSGSFAIVADVAVGAPAALPPTGADARGSIIAGSALLFAGAGFILFSMRRKAAQKV